ncbi:hypothetical protein [Streptomyces sp. LMG1-1-1.1]|uniref:hypothetical protein n=1 Tax=Streptomyces sp. LMG1-1-1.1 TaxID=3135245 RepID=UPI0034675DCD
MDQVDAAYESPARGLALVVEGGDEQAGGGPREPLAPQPVPGADIAVLDHEHRAMDGDDLAGHLAGAVAAALGAAGGGFGLPGTHFPVVGGEPVTMEAGTPSDGSRLAGRETIERWETLPSIPPIRSRAAARSRTPRAAEEE